ncbi:MAG TPA: ABC transporter ATP-binding protein [Phycisphaerae bacterium]|nr:ABC transporter ATP-binding protein [Phycisphaerae bacterium]
MPYAVHVQALKKNYIQGDRQILALRGVDLAVKPGEFVAIMGASGSGKSTLLHLCAALDRFDSGSIEVAGEKLETLSESQLTIFRRRRIGIVFQQFNLIPTLTAFENVALPRQLDGSWQPSDAGRIRELLSILKIDHRADHRPDALSGGEQQRVAIARALINNPPVLFADEPTGNLDSNSASQFWTLLDEAARASHTTIVMVTHEPAAAAHADRVVVLRDGQISGEFAPDSFTDPASLAAHYQTIAR